MRLNSIHRQTIANRAEKSDAFTARETELAHRSDALARRTRDTLYKAKVLTAAGMLDPKWVDTRTKFGLNVGGAHIILEFKEPTALPIGGYNGTAIVGTVEPGLLADCIMVWAGDVETLKADRKKAKAAVTALLESVSTVETLASIWPEGQKFYADLEIRKPDLPTVIGTDINKMLGVV